MISYQLNQKIKHWLIIGFMLNTKWHKKFIKEQSSRVKNYHRKGDEHHKNNILKIQLAMPKPTDKKSRNKS